MTSGTAKKHGRLDVLPSDYIFDPMRRCFALDSPLPDAPPTLRDLEREVADATCPGEYISWREEHEYVVFLEGTRARILAYAGDDPVGACALLETFHAACHAKADDVGGECDFAIFSGSLLTDRASLQLRMGIAPEQIMAEVISWTERDEYGHCSYVSDDVSHIIDRTTVAAAREQPPGEDSDGAARAATAE